MNVYVPQYREGIARAGIRNRLYLMRLARGEYVWLANTNGYLEVLVYDRSINNVRIVFVDYD